MSMLAFSLPQLVTANSWLLQGMLPRRQSHGVEEPVEVDPMSLDSSSEMSIDSGAEHGTVGILLEHGSSSEHFTAMHETPSTSTTLLTFDSCNHGNLEV